MDDRFRGLMLDAARLTRSGDLHEATRAIQRALAGSRDFTVPAAARADVLDGLVAVVDPAPADPDGTDEANASPPVREAAPGGSPGPSPDAAPTGSPVRAFVEPPSAPSVDAPADPSPTVEADPARDRGAFLAGSHAHGSTTRDYRLYVPPGAPGRSLPLVVMLHGCTQDPEDFAAGTGMNERAREQGFYVLYPAQSRKANPQGCWNWFKHTHQQPQRGEAGLIASMTRAVIDRHGVDPERVYVAGLSAGGAMAAIVAAGHPGLFAAAGVHSGLAPDAAASLPEALAAMQGGAQAQPSARGVTVRGEPRGRRRAVDVPTIVFHGDADRTVHPRNGEQVVEAVVRGGGPAAGARTERGTADGGRRWTRRVHAAGGDRPQAEHWVVHGAGHAWSGGSPAGSYTDPSGPDATGEMLRFFAEHRLGARRAA
ncbi:MAG TPA: PHB depolymerase family esterase [Burkholderiaceae bacterium]|nr:PHB depolymerase family esterase [Burkholderiaceae bacterium]